jgi:hypothetical protein
MSKKCKTNPKSGSKKETGINLKQKMLHHNKCGDIFANNAKNICCGPSFPFIRTKLLNMVLF